MSDFKKGDRVTLVGIWSDGLATRRHLETAGAIYTRACVVRSWGKVQATLSDADTGEFLKVRIYASGNDVAGTQADADNTLARLRERIGERRRKAIDFWRGWLESKPSDVEAAARIARLNSLVGSEPAVATWAELNAKLLAEMKADGVIK